MNKLIPLLSLLCVSLIAGCGHSPQKNYFVLSAPQPVQTSAAITQVVGIGPVTIADYLKRQRMVYLNDEMDLEVAENSFWAEPLDRGVARTLALNLVAAHPQLGTLNFPWRSDNKPPLSVRVDILGLGFNQGQASINADWLLFDNDKGEILQQHHFAASAPASKKAKGLARAYSQVLAQLAEQINQALDQQLSKQQPPKQKQPQPKQPK